MRYVIGTAILVLAISLLLTTALVAQSQPPGPKPGQTVTEPTRSAPPTTRQMGPGQGRGMAVPREGRPPMRGGRGMGQPQGRGMGPMYGRGMGPAYGHGMVPRPPLPPQRYGRYQVILPGFYGWYSWQGPLPTRTPDFQMYYEDCLCSCWKR